MIKSTGNTQFDRLYKVWVSYTKNTDAKSKALEKFKALTKKMSANTASTFVDNIIDSIVGKHHERMEKQASGKWVPEWCNISVYLNQKRYEDDSLESIQDEVKPKEYQCQDCGKPGVHRHKDTYCADCLIKNHGLLMPELRQYYKENNLGQQADETKSQWMERLSEFRKQKLAGFRQKITNK